MPAPCYRALSANSRFLRGISMGANQPQFSPEERDAAAVQAKVEIDAALATTFSVSDPPPLVGLLADLIGSAVVLEYLALSGSFGQDGEGARKPGYLRKKAEQIIADLRSHRIGIQNSDGTWNALYPAPSVLPSIGAGEGKALTIDPGLSWGQMAQPVISQEESEALGPERGRRSNDLEAAFAGAYGV